MALSTHTAQGSVEEILKCGHSNGATVGLCLKMGQGQGCKNVSLGMWDSGA